MWGFFFFIINCFLKRKKIIVTAVMCWFSPFFHTNSLQHLKKSNMLIWSFYHPPEMIQQMCLGSRTAALLECNITTGSFRNQHIYTFINYCLVFDCTIYNIKTWFFFISRALCIISCYLKYSILHKTLLKKCTSLI